MEKKTSVHPVKKIPILGSILRALRGSGSSIPTRGTDSSCGSLGSSWEHAVPTGIKRGKLENPRTK